MTTSTPTTERSDTDLATEAPVQLAVIVGSIRTDRFCPAPANWIADQARKRDGLGVDLIDLADYVLPADVGGNDPDAPVPEQVTQLGARLAHADAFVVVTPVYNLLPGIAERTPSTCSTASGSSSPSGSSTNSPGGPPPCVRHAPSARTPSLSPSDRPLVARS